MTAAPDYSYAIDGATWRAVTDPAVHLVVEPTDPGDGTAGISVYVNGDGPTARLDARQLRQLAVDLLDRADLLDNVPGRHRRTPAWHQREGERLLAASLGRALDGHVYAIAAQAHFLAALAGRALHTNPVTVHQHLCDHEGTETT